MKPHLTSKSRSWPATTLPCFALALLVTFSAQADDVTLGASNAIGTTSFNTALSWSNSAAPAAGNAYYVPATFGLRTPTGSPGDLTFAGDSLRMTSSNLVYKGDTLSTITIANLILDGGLVNNASNTSTPFVLAGGITIAGTGTSTLFSNNATITVSAPISGSTGTLLLSTNNTTGRQVVLSGANTYTGTIQVTGASGAVLDTTGSLKFAIGANGVNNTIVGTGPFIFNGAFNIDLSAASDTIGDHWTLVDVSALAATYGDSFSIPGFISLNNIWTSTSGTYQFNETTGILSRISTDSDSDGLPDSWELQHFGNLDQGAEDGFDANNLPIDGDFDNDQASNLMEYLAGTDPTDPLSFPDTDDDGLNDGWERYYFNNSLAQTADADPDGDFSSNLDEQTAGTDPGFKGNFPDADDNGFGDQISDGWEKFYFGSIEACDPEADADGDLIANLDEFLAGTDPKDQLSSPDTDNDHLGDGLPDGWEVKYFGLPGESLAVVIAKQSGGDDPDADGYDNASEYALGTDPTDANSVPGPVAWWRFEELTSGPLPAGAGGEAEYNKVVIDSTGNGNDMRTYNTQTAPEYSTDVPFATVPVDGQANQASLFFDGAADGSWLDLVYTDTTAPIRAMKFSAWTIEASFRMDAATGNQVVFSKDGNPLGGQPPFHLKFRASDQKLEVGMVDGTATARYASSTATLNAGEWYSVAATANATTLSLWLKRPGDSAYVLQESTAIEGAFDNDFTGLNDAWAAGRGRWNGGEVDYFKGLIDEIRISAGVLPSAKFLASPASSTFVDLDGDGLDDNWENTYFQGPGEGAAGDYDHDGTSNLAEYRLGLNPANPSSRFAARVTGSTVQWPAAAGLSFTVQRSTTLAAGSWTDVATVQATGAQGSWTDPAPPAGKAFYRVIFAE